jgi:TPR repeat protein
VRWYRRAAMQGYASAQAHPGLIYDNGDGVLKECVLANMWFNIYSVNGHETAGEWRDEIEKYDA